MLKRNSKYIPRINNGSTHIYKAYRGATLVFGKDKIEPCFAVVDDISAYTDRTWKDVYDKKTKKWYKLNNLNEYEEYGVMNEYGRLADGYSEVEYVYNDANNQGWNIDLGFKPNENHKYQIKMQPTELGGNAIAGDGETNDSDDYRFFFYNDGFGLAMDYGYSRVTKTGLNKDDVLGKIWELEFGNFYIKDLQSNTILASSTTISGSRSRNLQLFLRFSNSSSVATQDYEKIYYFKVYEGDNLIRDLVPCININNIPGFYDLITKQFYTTSNGVLGHGTVLNNSLEDITHYTGKLILFHGHQYKYDGTEWVDMGEFDPDADPNEYFIIPYKDNTEIIYIPFKIHWGNNYKVAIDCKIIGDYSGIEGGQFSAPLNNNGIPLAPIEFNSYSNGFYYDFHEPQSTTEPKCDGRDYNKRTIETSISAIPKDGTRIIASIDGRYVEFKRHDTGASLYKTTHSVPQNYAWYNGYYWLYFCTKNTRKVCQSGCKIYDNSNNLIHDVVVRYNPIGDAYTKVYLLDKVTGERFYTSSESPDFHVETANGAELPSKPQNIVQYDQKVAPADNVEYDTLEELELMECPWYGMKAIVGGKKYKYTKDGWEESKQYIEFNLNGQWVESTKKLDGYDVFESHSNYHKDNYFASIQVKWFGYPDFSLYINSYGENSFDYTVAWKMDKDAPTSLPDLNSSGVVGHTYQKSANPTSINSYTLVKYPNDGGEHFAWITYRKDFSGSYDDDRGRVAVKKDI